MAASSQDRVDVVGAANGALERLVDVLQPPFQTIRFRGRLGQRRLGDSCFVFIGGKAP